MLINIYSLLCDVEYFVSKLDKVKVFNDLGIYLINIIKSKEIKIAVSISSPSVQLPL
jgi:hypothetical protein